MKIIDNTINFRDETINRANDLGFDTYSEAVFELKNSGRSFKYIASLFDRSEYAIRQAYGKIK